MIVALDSLKSVVGIFGPYKTLKEDGIFSILLKKGLEVIAMPLCKLLRASLAMGYIRSCWQGSRVVFIPKAGRAQHGSVKDFRSIILTSLILKLLERLVVDR